MSESTELTSSIYILSDTMDGFHFVKNAEQNKAPERWRLQCLELRARVERAAVNVAARA